MIEFPLRLGALIFLAVFFFSGTGTYAESLPSENQAQVSKTDSDRKEALAKNAHAEKSRHRDRTPAHDPFHRRESSVPPATDAEEGIPPRSARLHEVATPAEEQPAK